MSKVHAPAKPGEYFYGHANCGYASTYVLPAIQKFLSGLPADAVVADAGCGNGSMLAALRKPGWELHGLEISSSGLQQAKQNFPEARYHEVDLAQDAAPPELVGRCDVVITTEVIEHVFLPRVFVRNCGDLLKDFGMLIVSTPYHGYAKTCCSHSVADLIAISLLYGTSDTLNSGRGGL